MRKERKGKKRKKMFVICLAKLPKKGEKDELCEQLNHKSAIVYNLLIRTVIVY